MNRRSFIKTSLVATTTATTVALPQVASADHHEGQKYLELRRIVIKSEAKRDFVNRFLKNAAIPALNRAGIKPVGVFHELPEANDYSITVLLQFNSLQQYGSWEAVLAGDSEFTDRGGDYLSAEKSEPAYDRIESSLMAAFEGFPEVKVPRTGERIFELRVYRSHSELKGVLKVEMFNAAELNIFKKVGLDGVFYGRSMTGSDLPNLTYMLAYKDDDEKKAAWKAFSAHPDWDRLKNNDRYKDTVSKVSSRMLIPGDGSQI